MNYLIAGVAILVALALLLYGLVRAADRKMGGGPL